MSCILTSNDFGQWDPCQFFAGGIQRLWVANWSQDLRGRLIVDGSGTVIDVNGALNFYEIVNPSLDNFVSVYTETYNPDDKDYTIRLEFAVEGWEEEKRETMDTLAKGSFIFAWLDFNGRYWFSFFENPAEAEEAVFTTGQRRNKQEYAFVYEARQSQPALEIDASLLEQLCSCDNLDLTVDQIMALPNLTCRIIETYVDCPMADIDAFVGA